MRKLEVLYTGWGERWPLGTLADDGRRILFEYSAQAIAQGLELSPRHLRLRPQAYGGFPDYLQGLPGFIADALPDGWGVLLMDRFLRRRGHDPRRLSALDRLAFVGHRAIGALTFEPAIDEPLDAATVELRLLAAESQSILAGADSTALRELALLGGSPHGARPKVLVHRDIGTGRMSTVPTAGSQPWLVKFQARGEHPEVAAIESLYAVLARECGLDMPETEYFDLGPSLSGFGVRRFDMEDGMRVPLLTLAGLMHADFRMPQMDYLTFLRATAFLTRDTRETARAFERAMFNVLFHNRDDHAKNVSYRLGRDRLWRLAPCYDLTFSDGPGGEHAMDIGGHGKDITRDHLSALAREAGVAPDIVRTTIDRMGEVASRLGVLTAGFPIRKASVEKIRKAVDSQLARSI